MQISLTEKQLNIVIETLRLYRQAEVERVAHNKMLYEMGMLSIKMAKDPTISKNPETLALAIQVEQAGPGYLQKIEEMEQDIIEVQGLLALITPDGWVSEWDKLVNAPDEA